MYTMVSLKEGASLIEKFNSKATLTLSFSQLVDSLYQVSVPDVDIL